MLLLIFLANIAGYKLAYWIARQSSSNALQVKLEEQDYNPDDLILIHVPGNMLYHEDQLVFERVDGEIEIDGVTYTYVERKIADGQIWLKCLWNKEAGRLNALKDDFLKSSNDSQRHPASQKQQEKLPNLNLVATDYDIDDVSPAREYNFLPKKQYVTALTYLLPQVFLATPEQPPDGFIA